MKIVIAGASGRIGRALVPQLLASGHDLVLVGRKAPVGFGSDTLCCDYDTMESQAFDADILLNLAVANTDTTASVSQFHRANCEFASELAARASALKIKRFLHVSSVHALDPFNKSAYAISKRDGDAAIMAMPGSHVVLYLGLAYGRALPLRLPLIKFLPSWVLSIVKSLKPTSDIDRLTSYINQNTENAAVQLAKLQFLLIDDKNETFTYRLLKRSMDLGVSVCGLALIGWLMMMIWCAVKLDSKGPGLFRQQRVGQFGRMFTCYKFRTMAIGTPEIGTHEVATTSITRLGHFLRRTKLDELPQLYNIVRNDMSLIGPRPSLNSQEELITARVSKNVLRAKPGLSGLSQINGIDMSDPVRLAEWDARAAALRGIIPEFSWLLKSIFVQTR